MSRNDSHDFEYPPGLGYSRSNGYHHTPSASLTGYTAPDRRPSTGYSTYTPQHTMSMMPRSVGISEQEYGLVAGDTWPTPNRHNPAVASSQHLSSYHHNLHRSSSPPPLAGGPSPNSLYNPPSYNTERDPYLFHHSPTSNQLSTSPAHSPSSSFNPYTHSSRSTLWWGELEPWMDEEYAKQVCGLMGWDPVNIKVPHPGPDPTTGQQANNPGYCFLTFPTPSHAASVLAQINNGSPVTMPNSTKPLVMNWASALPHTPLSTSFPSSGSAPSGAQQQFPKEYSIFVGDLAPETSNSDLVAVFRNPVLGLRNDREPKFIRPFLSCKSAKIMLDPVTGVSRGYGFVRFTDESDQQRALIEMHGLYCLSRPMRISPATAKFKPPGAVPAVDIPQVQFSSASNGGNDQQQSQGLTIALPLPSSNQTKSVSAPIAATPGASGSSSSPNSINAIPASGSGSGSSMSGSNSTPSLSSGSSTNTIASVSSEDILNLPHSVLAQIAQQYANSNNGRTSKSTNSATTPPFAQDGQEQGQPRYTISEESWKHHAQARAILGNLMGPNGEQLTSTDPYNTTVFVGGLSPLISEDTLRTFFAPFGDIHYVKVPVGKHCGFVQFVRKADAERAIEKMQGFPVGGSRIRLSWGRSQYKAAQAAAQAAQAAALQSQLQAQIPAQPGTAGLTPEQAFQLLQKFGFEGLLNNNGGPHPEPRGHDNGNSGFPGSVTLANAKDGEGGSALPFEVSSSGSYGGRPGLNNGAVEIRQTHPQTLTSFSPFSPDPNLYLPDTKRRDSVPFRNELLPHPSRSYAPGFGPSPLNTQDTKVVGGSSSGNNKVSPSSTRPSSASRYSSFLENSSSSFQVNRSTSRQDGTISRPTSTQAPQEQIGEYGGHEQDPIQDLNGTLASLNLDQQGMWRSPAQASDGSGSVQFRMAMGSHHATPSP